MRALYESKVADCVEQLRLLRAAHHQLEEDKRDKFQALEIDGSVSALDVTSREIGMHSESVRVPPQSVDPRDWDGYTRDNITVARREVAQSANLRESIDATIAACTARQQQQRNNVDDAFNTRLAEGADARAAVESNLKKTRAEIAQCADSIAQLDAAREGRISPLKMAETRLHQRSTRPNVELVRDPVQYSLIREVHEIESAVQTLSVTLEEAEEAHRALKRAELALVEDLRVKSISADIDNKCMLRRQQFKYASK